MTENLRLNLDNYGDGTFAAVSDSGKKTQLTSSNTDLDDEVWDESDNENITSDAYNYTTMTSSTIESWLSDGNDVYNIKNVPHSYTNGNLTTTTYDGDTQYYGNYYNWYAATAGTGTYDDNDADYSICPKGWGLPQIWNEKSYQDMLGDTYNVVNKSGDLYEVQSKPISLIPAGYYSDSKIIHTGDTGAGSEGWYWTKTSSGNTYASGLRFYPENMQGMSIGFTMNKNIGASIR